MRVELSSSTVAGTTSIGYAYMAIADLYATNPEDETVEERVVPHNLSPHVAQLQRQRSWRASQRPIYGRDRYKVGDPDHLCDLSVISVYSARDRPQRTGPTLSAAAGTPLPGGARAAGCDSGLSNAKGINIVYI